jgi:hypothetical protein
MRSDSWVTLNGHGVEAVRVDVFLEARDAQHLDGCSLSDVVAAAVGGASRAVPSGWRALHWEGFSRGGDFFLESFKLRRVNGGGA